MLLPGPTLVPLAISLTRVSEFAPTDIAGLQLWLSAGGTLWQNSGRTIPATTDTDPVGAADDGGPLGNNALQTTAGARPQYRTNQINSLPTILYDGADDGLLAATAGYGTDDTSYTVFAVVRPSTASGTRNVFACGGGVAYSFQLRHDGNTWNGFHWDGSSDKQASWSGVVVAGTAALLALRYDGTTFKLYGNATERASVGATQRRRAGSVFSVGYQGTGVSNQFFLGDIVELIAYDSALSTDDRESIETYLNDLYSIY